MIIKGGSRAGPSQLARHLQRLDTNERVEVLEIHSPHAGLADTFRDWQFLSSGTRGTKGLYHANIDPDARYKMTPEQWARCVEVLEEKLGLTGQPRAVVLHEKHGRTHLHVVWQRTDLETMTLVSDSHNYKAHEAASLALEKEFGHEIVPGKHAKRDRTKQPEPPKAQVSHDEWQQAERAGLDPKARKEAVTALYAQSDNGRALKAALEEKGYILAQGDRRDFVIVDAVGHVHSLARQIDGATAKELRAFMADIDRAGLPTVEQAKELQRAAEQEREKAAKAGQAPAALSAEEIAAIKDALTVRSAKEAAGLVARQENERQRTAEILDAGIQEKLDHLDARQHAARDQREREEAEQKKGIGAWFHAIRLRFSPALAAEEARRQQEADEALTQKLADERADYLRALQDERRKNLDDLDERHEQQRRDHRAIFDRDLQRHLRERTEAQRLAAEEQERQRQLDRQRNRDGPDPPERVR